MVGQNKRVEIGWIIEKNRREEKDLKIRLKNSSEKMGKPVRTDMIAGN